MLLDHFAINRIQAFLPAEHACFYIVLMQLAVNAVQCLGEQLASIATHCLDRTLQHPETHRMNVLERKILQLPRDVVQSEPGGYRHVDFQRFPGDPPTLFKADMGHRLQIVKAVGELDHHDAEIVRHGHQHFAEILCLRYLKGLKLDFLEL